MEYLALINKNMLTDVEYDEANHMIEQLAASRQQHNESCNCDCFHDMCDDCDCDCDCLYSPCNWD